MKFSLAVLSLLGSLALCHADAVRLQINGPGGKPVAGAAVHIVENGTGKQKYRTEQTLDLQSDATGQIALESKNPLSSQTATATPGAALSSLSARVTAPNYGLALLRLRAGDNAVTLQSGRALEGVVLDEAKQPVEGVKIELKQIAPTGTGEPTIVSYPQSVEALSDAGGHWRLDGLPASGSVEVKISSETQRYHSETLWLGITPPENTPPLFIEKSSIIKGRLLKPDGAPLGGVRIIDSDFLHPPISAADGTFQSPSVGEYTLLIVADKQPFLLPSKSVSKLQPGEVRDIGDWQGIEGIHIRGKVVDALTKAPIENATLNPNNRDGYGHSDKQGAFDFLVSPNATALSISAEGRATQTKIALPTAKAGVADVGTIALATGYDVSGTVTDGAGRPVPAYIQVTKMGATANVEFNERADDDGTFTFTGLEPGHYTVSGISLKVTAPLSFDVEPNRPLPKLQVKVENGKQNSYLNIATGTTTLISGRVLAMGQPVAGAKIRLDFGGGSSYVPSRTLVSNGDGTFSASLPLEGATPKVARVWHPDFSTGADNVAFALKDGAWRGDLPLYKAGEGLKGRIVDGAGHAVTGAFVAIENSPRRPIAADANGEFLLEGAPLSGLTLLASDGARFNSLQVEAGQPVQLVLPDVPPIPDKVAFADEILNALPLTWDWKENWDTLGTQRIERLIRQHGSAPEWTDYVQELAEREPQNLLAREAELRTLVPGGAQNELTQAAMLARASSPDPADKTRVRDYLALRQKERLDISAQSATKAFALAEIATRLDAKEGAAWLQYLSQITAQFPKGPTNPLGLDTITTRKWGESAARISPTAWKDLTSEWDAEPQLAFLLGAMNYYSEHGNVADARQTLRSMEEVSSRKASSSLRPSGFLSPADSLYSARLKFVHVLSPTNPSEALKMVLAMDTPWRDDFLIEVAAGAVKAHQLAPARKAIETMMQDGAVGSGPGSRAAALTLDFDLALSQKLFPLAYNSIVSSKAESQYFADYARARASSGAGESRILLEREWQMRQKLDAQSDKPKFLVQFRYRDLIEAMAFVSPRRALEMADQLTEQVGLRNTTRAKVALALLAQQ